MKKLGTKEERLNQQIKYFDSDPGVSKILREKLKIDSCISFHPTPFNPSITLLPYYKNVWLGIDLHFKNLSKAKEFCQIVKSNLY